MTAVDDDVSVGKTGVGGALNLPHGVRVYDATAVASAEFSVEEVDEPNAVGLFGTSVWLSFMADQPFFIIWGDLDNPPPDPDPDARWNGGGGSEVNPTQMCIRIPADYEYMRKVTQYIAPRFKLLRAGDTNAVVRVERVSAVAGSKQTGS